MTKREIIAVVVFVLGFMLCYGTVGHAELYDVWTSLHTVKCVIGMLLVFAAIPVSGDIPKRGGDEDERN